MKRILPLLLVPALAHASMFATGGEETILGDNTAVHSFTNSGTFVLSETKIVRILVVGGGGGGGAECGGGGGGGGVIEEMAYEMPAGTYGITIGAGGIGGREGSDRGNGNERGGNGGATIVTNSAGTELFRALGGGGGGGWANRSGVAGASGGGAAAKGSGGATLDPAQGNSAGSALGGDSSLPTGGGGAGAASENVTLSKGGGYSGAGGAGLTSDISGTAQMYGAGGGGGNYNYSGASAQAPGGDGFGGFGQGNTSALTGNEKGRDGFGGGGGGGSNVRTYVAADGGSGAVIIRLANSSGASETPVLVVTGATAGPDHVAFAVSVVEAGSGSSDGTVSVFAQIADDASAWDAQTGAFSGAERTLATGMFPGSALLRAIGLRPSHAYVARIVVRNDDGAETVSDPIAFSTPGLSEPRWTMDGRAGEPGLWQLMFGDSGGNDVGRDFDEATPNVTVQIGTIAAGLANGHSQGIHGKSYLDADGNVWSAGSHVSYAYVGWMWMEAGTTYTFFEFHYDGARLEIDGTDVIRNTVWDRSTVASYACQRTGWHRVRVWLTSPGGTNLGVPPNWSLSFGWNTNGVTDLSGNPGAAWIPFENTAENVFLRTEPTGRTVDISAWSLAGNAATFDAALGAGLDETDLYAVWGPSHGGDTTNGWAHVARVGSAAVGTAAATASYAVQDLSDLAWFRFVAIDERGLCAWSPSQMVDLSAPAIGIAGVAHDGDRATVSVRVDALGTGDFTMRLLWGENADLSGASVTNVAVSATGVYDLVVPVTPGATTYYRAEASTTDGGSDATVVDSFTTLAGSALSANTSAAVAQHWITFGGQLAALGAGTTAVTLWTGESPDALVADPEPLVVPSLAPFTIRRLVAGAPRTIYWKLTSANAAPGGSSWSNETAVATTAPSEAEIVYAWKADVAEGAWNDTNNWITATEGAFGFPSNVQCYASFPAGTTSIVHVAGSYDARIQIFDRAGVEVTLVGDGAAASSLYTGDSLGGSFDRSTLTLDGMTLEEQDFFDWWIGNDAAHDARVVLTNGAVLKLGGGGAFGVRGTDCGFTVGEGCAFLVDDPDTVYRSNQDPDQHFILAGLGEALTIEGRFVACSLHPEPPEGEAGQRMRLRGPDAQAIIANGEFGDVGILNPNHRQSIYTLAHPAVRDFDVVFEPAGPYTNTVSYSAGGETVTEAVALVSTTDAGRAMGEMILDESVGKIRLSVDMASMRHSGRSVRQHLVLWKNGIDTDHVELVPGDGYTLSYTYSWPSTLSAPENAGDLPTGVWAEIDAEAGTLILVR